MLHHEELLALQGAHFRGAGGEVEEGGEKRKTGKDIRAYFGARNIKFLYEATPVARKMTTPASSL